MNSAKQTKAQLLAQLEVLRQRVAELEAAEVERKRAEEALQDSETRYRRLFETAQDGILLLEADTGRITDVNPFLIKMLGYSHAELLGKRLWEIGPFKDTAASQAAFAELQNTGYVRYEDLPLETSDGRRMNVEFVSNVYPVNHHQVIQCNIRDITKRKQAEEALSQSNAELQERNEELDAFAHTVAHDLTTPVHIIVGNAEVLSQDYTAIPDDQRQQSLEAVARSGRKLAAIIDELLLLAKLRKSEVETAPLDMASIVAESVNRLADSIKRSRAEIILPDASAWPVVVGYGPWVEEVWTNYLSNALKYGDTTSARPCIELGAELQADDMVRFWVRDDGPGLTPEAQSRLFMPFTRLTQVRTRGHGLGLSIVRRIVEKIGGQVGVKSQMGDGSTFYFTLPSAK